ncbi:hypothetical protein SAY87_012229 [Trapa incisa]|uniref:Plant bHLH transcription factor ACT-like domain-containing protein n=1 Tax=Trapa incisa TaxID=236973 RepID=A0AAN7H0T4_9MYRT|nr:hypothetical protein SAY87_012229 [Trapa incisa]
MSSRDRKGSDPFEDSKHHQPATSSSSGNAAAITEDAAKDTKEFKDQQEETPNEEISNPGASSKQNLPMEVDVQTLGEAGFRISMHSETNCPGLLVSILEAFEELGLDVLDASVSCEDNFHLEAVGKDEGQDGVDARVVKQAVLQAIKNWSQT